MIGWTSAAFAQTNVEQPTANTAEVKGSDGISYTYEAPLFYIQEGINSFDRLRFILGYGSFHRNVNHGGSVELADTNRLSRFQLIVDEHGTVEDCTLVKSAQYSKDKNKIVENFLHNNRIFDGPGYLNGEPCKSVVLLTVRYYENGDVHMNRKSCYPLIALPDSEAAPTVSDD